MCVYIYLTHTFFTCICRSADGRLWTWGNSEYGQGMTGAKVDRVSYGNTKTIMSVLRSISYFTLCLML